MVTLLPETPEVLRGQNPRIQAHIPQNPDFRHTADMERKTVDRPARGGSCQARPRVLGQVPDGFPGEGCESRKDSPQVADPLPEQQLAVAAAVADDVGGGGKCRRGGPLAAVPSAR